MKFLQKVSKNKKKKVVNNQNQNSTTQERNDCETDTFREEPNMIHDPERDLLRQPCFYWPNLNHKDSEDLIKNRADGAFLVRKSSHSEYKYTVTYKRNGTVASARIQYCSEKSVYSFNFASKYLPKTYTIRELVASVAGQGIITRKEDCNTQTSATMRLEFPMYRTMSLMEQCKARILEHYPNNKDIDGLGLVLPKSLILYLKQ